jgi:flavodoxin
MKNVIVYYSFSQNNEKLARYLSEKMDCETMKIETVKKRNGFSIFLDLVFRRGATLKPLAKSLAGYDHVIFVSPIWAGKISTPLRAFLKKENAMIGRYSFISLCGGVPEQKEKIEKELAAIMGKKPQWHVELSVNDLLPVDQRNTIKHTTGYRVEQRELENFEPQLREFIQENSLVGVA